MEPWAEAEFGILFLTPSNTGSGSVEIQIPNTVPGKESYKFTINYTINNGAPSARFWYEDALVTSGATIDLGDMPLDRRVTLPLSVGNQGTAPFTINSASSSDLRVKLNNDNPITVPPNNNTGAVLDLDLRVTPLRIEGQTYTTPVTMDTTQGTVTFTFTYRALLAPPDNFWLEKGSTPFGTYNSISVNWLWDPSVLPVTDVTAFRVYRSTAWAGPYVQVGSDQPLASGATLTQAEIDRGWPAEAKHFTYPDSGLVSDTRYYYRIDAALVSGHPGGHTAMSMDRQSWTTYDSANRGPYDSNDWWNPAGPLPLNTLVTTWFYPVGESSVRKFTPTAGKTYTIEISNVSLTSGCGNMFWDGTTKWEIGPVDRWGNWTQTFTWDCPLGFDTTTVVKLWNGAWGDCSGSYTIKITESP
jgi:hypothetical protein